MARYFINVNCVRTVLGVVTYCVYAAAPALRSNATWLRSLFVLLDALKKV